MAQPFETFRPFNQEWYEQAQNDLLYYFSQLDASYGRSDEATILPGDHLPEKKAHDTSANSAAMQQESRTPDLEPQDETREKLYYLQRQANKGELASVMAHEFNNHLMAISGNLFFAIQSIDTRDTDQSRDRIQRCLDKIEDIKNLTEALQSGNRVQACFGDLNVNATIQGLLDWAQPLLQKNGAQFVLHLKQDLPVIQADSVQLQQVLFNLLNNAVQARQDCTVHIYSQISNAEIVVRILDDGPGIAPDNLKKLFKPFFSLREGGHGLGLNIVKDIITAHGGNISVQSEPGKGTAFKIALPVESPFSQPRRQR